MILDCFHSLREGEEMVTSFFAAVDSIVFSLVRGREFHHDFRQHFHAFVECRKRYALVVSMHPPQIFLCQRKRNQSVRLHIVQPQLG